MAASLGCSTTSQGERAEVRPTCGAELFLELSHDGTGAPVEKPGSAMELARTRLMQSMWRAVPAEGARVGRLALQSGGTTTWLDTLLESVAVKVVGATDLSSFNFALQSYHFKCSVGIGRVWWSLIHAVDILMGCAQSTNYVGQQKASMAKWLLSLGFSGDDIRPSRKSFVTMQQQSEDTLAEPVGSLLQFWSVSTRGLICIILHWCVHGSRLKESVDVHVRAARILDCIMDRFSQEGPVCVRSSVDDSVLLEIFEGHIEIAALEASDHAWAAPLASRLRKLSPGQTVARIRCAMEVMLTIMERPSRCRSVRDDSVRGLLHLVLETMHRHMELSASDTWWGLLSPLELTPSPGKKRLRPMSLAYKEAVLEASKSSTDPLSVRQLLGADRILRCKSASSSDATARRVLQRNGLLYLAQGRRHFANFKTLHLTFDGVAAGGDENDIYVAWDPRAHVAGVIPIQVFVFQ